jgi:hypothetical protein
MDHLVTKYEVLATLYTERQHWETVLLKIGKENMIQTGVAGHWSVKHVIAHIAAYESWLEKCKPVSSHPQNCSDQNPGT